MNVLGSLKILANPDLIISLFVLSNHISIRTYFKLINDPLNERLIKGLLICFGTIISDSQKARDLFKKLFTKLLNGIAYLRGRLSRRYNMQGDFNLKILCHKLILEYTIAMLKKHSNWLLQVM